MKNWKQNYITKYKSVAETTLSPTPTIDSNSCKEWSRSNFVKLTKFAIKTSIIRIKLRYNLTVVLITQPIICNMQSRTKSGEKANQTFSNQLWKPATELANWLIDAKNNLWEKNSALIRPYWSFTWWSQGLYYIIFYTRFCIDNHHWFSLSIRHYFLPVLRISQNSSSLVIKILWNYRNYISFSAKIVGKWSTNFEFSYFDYFFMFVWKNCSWKISDHSLNCNCAEDAIY